jgi:hypothetical protein
LITETVDDELLRLGAYLAVLEILLCLATYGKSAKTMQEELQDALVFSRNLGSSVRKEGG